MQSRHAVIRLLRRRTPVAALLVAAGCSTVAPPPTPKACISNEDCDLEAGEVCAVDQGRCYPATEVPPLAHLGLDIQEPASAAGEGHGLRVEVAGCDAAVELVSTDDRRITVRRAEVTQRWAFALTPTLTANPPGATGTVEIRSPSRIGLRDVVRTASVMDTPDGPMTPWIDWAFHHPRDAVQFAPGGASRAVLRIDPETGEPPYVRYMAPPAARSDAACETDEDCCESPPCSARVPPVCLGVGEPPALLCSHVPGTSWLFDTSPVASCQRSLRGEVQLFAGLAPGTPVSGANVLVRHADLEDTAPLAAVGMGAAPPEQVCTSDLDCVDGLEVCRIAPGQFAGRCGVPLAGLPTHKGTLATDDDGAFDAPIYTYCDEAPDAQHDRAFDITVLPPPQVPAPGVEVHVTATFLASGGVGMGPGAVLADPICLPAWASGPDAVLEVSGAPVDLYVTGDGQTVTCCDVGCLAMADSLGQQDPPDATTCAPVTAAGSARLTVTAPVPAPSESEWEDRGCAPLRREGGRLGTFIREADCDADGSCSLSALPSADAPIDTYTLRVESPMGSVLASTIASVPAPLPASPMEIVLPRRVLLRGTVRLREDLCDTAAAGDCADVNALVIAERLRMPGESESTVPGPYYHTVPTFTDPSTGEAGHYVLPLDPGVWLVTALPQSGARGDPAPIELLDLRDGADREHDFVLPLGIRVTVELRGFDDRTTVVPWDLGSWRDLDHPGRDGPVDLSAEGECLSTSPDRGCRIRALSPQGVALLPSITGTVQVTARTPKTPANCPP